MSFATPKFSLELALLGIGALALYFAGRFAMNAIPARSDRASVRAWLAAMAVALVSLTAIACDRPLIGLHLPIACAAAALTFGLGVVLVGRPMRDEDAAAVPRRSWPLVLPAATMAGIVAFAGTVGPIAMATLAAFGALAIAGWRDGDVPAEAPAAAAPRRAAFVAVAIWSMAAVAAVVAGALTAAGLPALESLRQLPSDALATVFLLAPAIVVPMTFELLPPCRSIGPAASVSTVARFATICLALALPLSALAAAARPAVATYVGMAGVKQIVTAPTTGPATQPAILPTSQPTTARAAPTTLPVTPGPTTLRYVRVPAVPQRADLLVIAAAALFLLPLATGRVRAGRLEAAALIGVYLFYLALVMLLVVR